MKLVKKTLSLAVSVLFVVTLVVPMTLKVQIGSALSNTAKVSQKDVVTVAKASIVTTIGPARDIKANLDKKEDGEPKPNLILDAVVTAYTSTPDQTDDTPFIAATGKRVYDGMIAANNLPFGTKIKLPELYGDKIFTVDDRMNSRYGLGRMDVWMDAPRQEAMQFGIKRVRAEVFYPSYALTMK